MIAVSSSVAVSASMSPMATTVANRPHNPEFYEKEKLRFSTRNTPRFIRCYRETIDQLLLPRGLRDKASTIVKELGSRLTVLHGYADVEPIDVTLRAVLTAEQIAGTEALAGHEFGVLVAPPGSGKPWSAAP